MSRRITVALLGLVAAAVLLSGLGGILLARRAAMQDDEEALQRQVAGLATLVVDRGNGRRTGPVRAAVLEAFELSGFEVVDLADTTTDIRPGALTAAAAGEATTYRDGRTLVAVVPSTGGGTAVVGTRAAPGALGRAGPWVALSSIVVLAVAAAVAASLSRRLTAPLAAAQAVAGRIAAGDLGARAGDLGDDELGDLGRSIDAMAASLEDARGLQRTFLLSVSHDLRTPLTSIRGFGELLADDDEPEHARMGARIESEARRLERLVSDLLDLATLDARRPSLHPADLDLVALAAGVVEGLDPAASAAGVALRLEATGPIGVHADRDRVDQVVVNLVENAIGFARAEVEVQIVAGAGEVSLVVRDDGPGIPADVLPHVFERLRTSRPRTRSGGPGSGLGLSIAAELAVAMGGRLTVQSPPGAGASFELRLPASVPGVPGGVGVAAPDGR